MAFDLILDVKKYLFRVNGPERHEHLKVKKWLYIQGRVYPRDLKKRTITLILYFFARIKVLYNGASMIVFAFWPVVFVFVLVTLLKYVILFLVVFSYFIKSYFVVIMHKNVSKIPVLTFHLGISTEH